MKYATVACVAFALFHVATPLSIKTQFVEIAGDLPNPERGFTQHTDGITFGSTPLQLYKVDMSQFCGAEYASTFPDAARTQFVSGLNAFRAAKKKAYVRFFYSKLSGIKNSCGWFDPASNTVVSKWLTGIAPTMASYLDVISFVEAGVYGRWGEWHNYCYADQEGASVCECTSSSSARPPAPGCVNKGAPVLSDINFNSQARTNHNYLIDALLASVPANRKVLLRLPDTRDRQVARGLPGVALARLGYHNDCFLSSPNDSGTYPSTKTLAQWENGIRANTLSVPIGGETCPGSQDRFNCDVAQSTMQNMRFTYLNKDWYPGAIDRWAVQGCLETIRNRLGYRFVITRAEYSESPNTNGQVSVRLYVKNTGYAPMYNSRTARIALRSSGGTYAVAGSLALPIVSSLGDDVSTWFPGDTSTFEQTLNVSGLPFGTWSYRLSIPDPYSSDASHAVRLASKTAGTTDSSSWDAYSGQSVLDMSFSSGLPTPEPVSTPSPVPSPTLPTPGPVSTPSPVPSPTPRPTRRQTPKPTRRSQG